VLYYDKGIPCPASFCLTWFIIFWASSFGLMILLLVLPLAVEEWAGSFVLFTELAPLLLVSWW